MNDTQNPAPAHTPGPWLIARNGAAGHTFNIWRNDHGGQLSPEGKNEGWANIATYVAGEANARLIAAAPDLLAACQKAERNLSPLYCSEHVVMVALRAAIARATGN